MSVFCIVRIKNDLFYTEATPKRGGLSVLSFWALPEFCVRIRLYSVKIVGIIPKTVD